MCLVSALFITLLYVAVLKKLPVICNCIKNELTEIELISVVGYVLQVHML